MNAQYDLYNYVAANNPTGAKALLDKYGYDASQVVTVEALGSGLATMVKENGEPALRDLLAIHPDKDALLQEFGMTASAAPAGTPAKSPCGCGGGGGCKGANALAAYLDKTDNSSGNGNGNATSNMMQHSNMLLVGGILILVVALIVTKK